MTTNPEFWEDFYADGKGRWSGRANALLVDAATDLTPGVALDLGSGQGGDAVWLATMGWQVVAVDISTAALTFAAEHATTAGVSAAISWERHDLDVTFPDGEYDLVTTSYLHSPVELGREAILRRALPAVRPGGHLIVIGHAGPPSWDPGHHHGVELPSAAEVVAALDLPADWAVERCAEVDVAMQDPDGNPATRLDSVVHVRRPAA